MVAQVASKDKTERLNGVDPRVKRTRRLLLEAFTALQKEKSITLISVQDIAERATVNRATFYAHFEDKYALMDCWMREEFQQVLERELPAPSQLSLRTLRILIETVFGFLGGFYSSCKRSDTQFEPMFETAMQQELGKLLLLWLSRLPSASRERGEAIETTAEVISWAIFGPAVQWSRGERTRSAEAMSSQVMKTVVAGLSGITGPIS